MHRRTTRLPPPPRLYCGHSKLSSEVRSQEVVAQFVHSNLPHILSRRDFVEFWRFVVGFFVHLLRIVFYYYIKKNRRAYTTKYSLRLVLGVSVYHFSLFSTRSPDTLLL